MNSPQIQKLFKPVSRYKIRKGVLVALLFQVAVLVLTIITSCECVNSANNTQTELAVGFYVMLLPCLILIASTMPSIAVIFTLIDLFNNKKILKIFEIIALIGSDIVLIWLLNGLNFELSFTTYLTIGVTSVAVFYLIMLIIKKEK